MYTEKKRSLNLLMSCQQKFSQDLMYNPVYCIRKEYICTSISSLFLMLDFDLLTLAPF